MSDSTKRFSDKVDNYIKYRPSYPDEMIDYFITNLGVNNNSVIADVGSGTGILTKKLLPKCKQVYGIEPNAEMRKASEIFLNDYANYISINGTSENTNINSNTIDFITVAQAFHWFEINKTLIEFKRILKNNGRMILIWNNRLNNTDFLKKYEELLKLYGTDYNEVNHQNITDTNIVKCFKSNYKKVTFDNFQEFDFNGVIGRLLSCSYAPKKETNEYKLIEEELKKAFTKYSINKKIVFNYETNVYSGEI